MEAGSISVKESAGGGGTGGCEKEGVRRDSPPRGVTRAVHFVCGCVVLCCVVWSPITYLKQSLSSFVTLLCKKLFV